MQSVQWSHKKNGVKRAISKVRFGWCLWIVRKLDINDFFLMLRVCWRCLIVNMQRPHVILLVSCHTNPLCFLLLCLMKQLKIRYFPWEWKVYVGVHPIMIRSRMTWECQLRFSRKISTFYYWIGNRSLTCLNVHLSAIHRRHSWISRVVVEVCS